MSHPYIPTLRWYGTWQSLFSRGIPHKFHRILGNWLLKQRWCLEKSERKVQFALQKAIPVMNEQVWWLFVQTTQRTYQLPLALVKEPFHFPQPIARIAGCEHGLIVDAWQWSPFAQWVLQTVSSCHTDNRFLVWKGQEIVPVLHAQILAREQSNTAIVFWETYFLKALRVVTSGVQPEEEISKALTTRRFPHSIPVLASISAATNPEPSCLALLYQYASVQANGWDWYLHGLGQLMVMSKTERETQQTMLVDAASQLGQNTRKLHECLSLPSEDSAFRSEPFTEDDGQNLCTRIRTLYQNTCTRLRTMRNGDSRTGSFIKRLRMLRSTVIQLTRAPLPMTERHRQRVHGDYHLGQVLRTDDDWLIIDFEGEPLRPMSERRAKDLPYRDVAGMLRSFAYLEHSACCAADKSQSETLHDVTRQLQDAFVRAYFHPQSNQQDPRETRFLKLYMLEKSLYEINYELASRPDWLVIPLQGAVELLEELVPSVP